MKSIREFWRTLSKICTIRYGLFKFSELREHLLMAAFTYLEALVFQNTWKWMLSSLSNRAIFFSGYFDLKNYQKRRVHLFSFSFPWWERIPLLLFVMFSWIRLRRYCPKAFLYWWNLKILISLKRLTFSINHNIPKTYLHKKFIYIGITKTKQTKYCEKFTEEVAFAKLSMRVKHLRVWILHGDSLNDRLRYYC